MAEKLDLAGLKTKANEIRKKIIKITTEAGSGHPTSSLSATEVVTALYFGGYMKHDPKNPKDPDRDRFILSKGHAVPVQYSAMCEAGYYKFEEIMTLRKLGSPWEGHPNTARLPGMEASTGSLGQGLSLGVGHALAAKLDGKSYKTFVMMGDGEIDQGQVWEAFASAEKYGLSNLVAIIDRNKFQQTGACDDVLPMDSLVKKSEAFGWKTVEINGNDMEAVCGALDQAVANTDGPFCIVSQTQKGFGILPILEETGDMNFHGQPLPPALAEKALAHLGA